MVRSVDTGFGREKWGLGTRVKGIETSSETAARKREVAGGGRDW